MLSKRRSSYLGILLLVVVLVVVHVLTFSMPAWAANTTTVLYSFTGGTDGGDPASGLAFDGAGNIYRTTVVGGAFGFGTVFELSPSANGWSQTVLHSFAGAPDGQYAYGGVTLDSAGNLYGTTVSGGTGSCGGGCGVVFQLTNSAGVGLRA